MDEGLSCFTPAHELARLIRAREVSIPEITALYLQRIEQRNPALGAYVCVLAQEALDSAVERQRELDRGEAVGPLHGLPIAIKDLDDLAGVPTRCSSRTMSASPAAEDSIFAARLRKAGAVFLGKTNTPEFGHKGTTDSLLFGPASSPFKTGKNAGGSSGGAAAAAADGLAAIAQGGDGGGSIRIPAALCGVYGFKPSWGRVAHAYRPGAFLFTPFVSHGPLARTVEDAAILTQAMIGPHPRDPLCIPDDGIELVRACGCSIEGLRIAYSPNLGVFPVDARVSEVVGDAVGALSAAGALVDKVDPKIAHSQQELSAVWRRGIAVQHAQMVAGFKMQGTDLLALGDDGLEPCFRQLVEEGEAVSALDYKLDDIVRTHVFDAIEDVFADYDLLVCPTCSVPAVENATDGTTVGPSEVDGEAVDPLIGWCLTYPFNFTGHPAASAPAGLTADGLPVGMQIVARRHRDDVVLAASAALQRVRPWAHAYPGLHDDSSSRVEDPSSVAR
jgi:Asp-tRNA(Asn)/Glu-tRNA(Gln) amidotransferase A subunit family amidase